MLAMHQCTCTHGGGALGGFTHASGCPLYCPQTYNVANNYGYAWTGAAEFPPDPPRLHQDDVERIARRVVELLKETP